MPRADGFVRVTGLRDLARAMREIDKTLPRELGGANQKVAQHIVDEATETAQGLGPLWARAAKSMKAARKQRIAAINFGGGRHPEAMGAEFGAGRNQLRNTTRGVMEGWNQFRPWRGSDTGAGYFLYPTIRREGDRIVELYAQVLDDLIAQHL
jgi:hypothetical protein